MVESNLGIKMVYDKESSECILKKYKDRVLRSLIDQGCGEDVNVDEIIDLVFELIPKADYGPLNTPNYQLVRDDIAGNPKIELLHKRTYAVYKFLDGKDLWEFIDFNTYKSKNKLARDKEDTILKIIKLDFNSMSSLISKGITIENFMYMKKRLKDEGLLSKVFWYMYGVNSSECNKYLDVETTRDINYDTVLSESKLEALDYLISEYRKLKLSGVKCIRDNYARLVDNLVSLASIPDVYLRVLDRKYFVELLSGKRAVRVIAKDTLSKEVKQELLNYAFQADNDFISHTVTGDFLNTISRNYSISWENLRRIFDFGMSDEEGTDACMAIIYNSNIINLIENLEMSDGIVDYLVNNYILFKLERVPKNMLGLLDYRKYKDAFDISLKNTYPRDYMIMAYLAFDNIHLKLNNIEKIVDGLIRNGIVDIKIDDYLNAKALFNCTVKRNHMIRIDNQSLRQCYQDYVDSYGVSIERDAGIIRYMKNLNESSLVFSDKLVLDYWRSQLVGGDSSGLIDYKLTWMRLNEFEMSMIKRLTYEELLSLFYCSNATFEYPGARSNDNYLTSFDDCEIEKTALFLSRCKEVVLNLSKCGEPGYDINEKLASLIVKEYDKFMSNSKSNSKDIEISRLLNSL